jgi:hypothetical protein
MDMRMAPGCFNAGSASNQTIVFVWSVGPKHANNRARPSVQLEAQYNIASPRKQYVAMWQACRRYT